MTKIDENQYHGHPLLTARRALAKSARRARPTVPRRPTASHRPTAGTQPHMAHARTPSRCAVGLALRTARCPLAADTCQVSARSWPAGKWWPSQPAGGRLAATSRVDGAGAARTARRERCAGRTPRPLACCIAPAAPQCATCSSMPMRAVRRRRPRRVHGCRARQARSEPPRRGGQATASGRELADAGGELAFWAWPQLVAAG